MITFAVLFGSIGAYYIEDKSLAGFNYETGASVLVVQASLTEGDEYKALAEKVLSTLRVSRAEK